MIRLKNTSKGSTVLTYLSTRLRVVNDTYYRKDAVLDMVYTYRGEPQDAARLRAKYEEMRQASSDLVELGWESMHMRVEELDALLALMF